MFTSCLVKMSLINFQKATNKKYLSHKEVEDSILEHAANKEAKIKDTRRNNYKESLTIDKQWMLPSLYDRISTGYVGSGHDKSNRKKTKSLSNSDSDDYDAQNLKDKRKSKKKRIKEETSSFRSGPGSSGIESKIERDTPLKRDDWMNVETLASSFGVEKKSKVKVKKDVNTCIIAAPGQSDRELNPYWKNGGTGLPSVVKDLSVTSHSVGDRGLEWYERALRRAQETAKEEGRSLSDVVSERWGSLEKLSSLITEAKSKKEENKHYKSNSNCKRRMEFLRPGEEYGRTNSDSSRDKRKKWSKDHGKIDDVHLHEKPCSSKDYKYEKRQKHNSASTSDWASDGKRKNRDNYLSKSSVLNIGESQRRDKQVSSKPSSQKRNDRERSEEPLTASPDEKKHRDTPAKAEKNAPPVEIKKVLTDEEINKLAAKLVKAEIMNKLELVEKLKTALADAREAREKAVKSAGTLHPPIEETVVLMKTNREGLSRPMQRPLHPEPTGGRRKAKKIETHSEGQRVRYFADDDQRDLKEMFQREKLSSGDDDKELFIKMAVRRTKAGSDEEDAAFADAARMANSSGKQQQQELDLAISEARRQRKTLDNCPWCLDSPERAKHLVVSIGETCYLCLPAEESLTPLHCLLVPIQHVTCGTLLDEDVWEEMHRFRKAVTAMATARSLDVIFFEQARMLKNFPHMVLHCVVLDREAGDMAPIYFKKALLDSESEWANNKKVVDIKGKDVRGTIPKGLPYFAVEFPPQKGFAHVIEDEKLFPVNFAHSVIGGMLDLDHRKWRKPQSSTLPAQREKTVAFSRVFSKYDFTIKKKQCSSSSSSESDSTSSESD